MGLGAEVFHSCMPCTNSIDALSLLFLFIVPSRKLVRFIPSSYIVVYGIDNCSSDKVQIHCAMINIAPYLPKVRLPSLSITWFQDTGLLTSYGMLSIFDYCTPTTNTSMSHIVKRNLELCWWWMWQVLLYTGVWFSCDMSILFTQQHLLSPDRV